jgi:non-specific serine/threonine protein kinase
MTEPGVDPVDAMAPLLENSLIIRLDRAGPEPRFSMLETIREFGLEQLDASGEAESIRRRHAAWCLTRVEALSPRFKGPGAITALDLLGAELPNLRDAIPWALSNQEIDLALRLAIAIHPSFWFSRGNPSEGRQWLEAGLQQPDEVPPRTRIDALDAAAMLAAVQADYPHARHIAEQSQLLAREHDYPFGRARADFCFAIIAEWQNDFDQAAAHYEAALGQLRRVNDPYWIAMTLTGLAVVRHRQGNHDSASTLVEEGLSRWRGVGNPWGIAMALTAAAAIVDDKQDRARMAALHHEAITLWIELDDKRGIAGAIAGLANVAASHGQPEPAARLLGAASALIESIGIAHPVHPAAYERAVIAAQLAMGPARFEAEWAAGRKLSLADAIAAAIAITAAEANAAGTGSQPPFGLTSRELDVVRLLARRATNKEIARALFISPRTVGRHVDSILRKLGVASRREVAAVFLPDPPGTPLP